MHPLQGTLAQYNAPPHLAMGIRSWTLLGIKCAFIIFLIALPSVVDGLRPPPCIRGLVGCDEYEDGDSVREDAIRETRESTDRFSHDIETSGSARSRDPYYTAAGEFNNDSYTWRRRLDGTFERVPLHQRTSIQQRPGLTTFTKRPFERATSKKISTAPNVQGSNASKSSQYSSVSIVGGKSLTAGKNSIKKGENLSAALLHSSTGEYVAQTGCVNMLTINPWYGEDDDVIGAKCFLAGVFDPLDQKDAPWWENETRTSFQYWTFIFAAGFGILLVLMLLSRSKRQSEKLAF